MNLKLVSKYIYTLEFSNQKTPMGVCVCVCVCTCMCACVLSQLPW